MAKRGSLLAGLALLPLAAAPAPALAPVPVEECPPGGSSARRRTSAQSVYSATSDGRFCRASRSSEGE
jgi:hypothetical protein